VKVKKKYRREEDKQKFEFLNYQDEDSEDWEKIDNEQDFLHSKRYKKDNDDKDPGN
jgi:hypothetical protein